MGQDIALIGSGDVHLDGVRPVCLKPEIMQVYIVVPNRFAIDVLGNGGVAMKRTAVTVGCKVRMASGQETDNHLICMIGNYHQCALVQEIVHRRLTDAARRAGQEVLSDIQVAILVRMEAAGIVIGKQGYVLNQIRKQCDVKLQFLREHVNGQRPCILKGDLCNVLQAERQIFQLTRSVGAVESSQDGLDLPWSPPPFSPAPIWASPFATPLPSPQTSP